MARPLRILGAFLACVSAAAAAAPAAATPTPARGRCLGGSSGPRCVFDYAELKSVSDGDTIRVSLHGQTRNIRFLGIQAMELHRYSYTPSHRRGECHSLAAAAEVDRLMREGHGRVRLAAQAPRADSRGRLERSVAVYTGGRWVDVGERLMAKGLTIWLTNLTETAWNRRYDVLEQRAAQRHIGMFDTTTCGAGPQQDVPIRVWAQTDPPGVDNRDIDGEWIKVQNRSPTRSLSLAHWWVRDAMLRRFTFPRGTTLRPGQTATVHVGRGRRAGDVFYWGLPVTVFENSSNPGNVGDGAYLFDPHGDLRGWMIYPCLVACTDPLRGAVALAVDPRAEIMTVRNTSAGSVGLYGYELAGAAPYAFPAGSVLAPGARLRVVLHGRPQLPDGGGAESVATFNGIRLTCTAWGYGRC